MVLPSTGSAWIEEVGVMQNIATIVVLLLAPAVAVVAQDVDSLKAGVVKISAVSEGVRKSGTGFIVSLTPDTAYIVTASHVVVGTMLRS